MPLPVWTENNDDFYIATHYRLVLTSGLMAVQWTIPIGAMMNQVKMTLKDALLSDTMETGIVQRVNLHTNLYANIHYVRIRTNSIKSS